ncbi:MAG TPA: SIMPL domain-containing protein, partial [Cytophagales bacterium]|nr:SIMPL domain-containing protein [Cytophagales bacterium]
MRPTYIFFMIILWANVGFAQSSTKNFIDENYIEVTGTARIEIIPDEIYLKIIINEE